MSETSFEAARELWGKLLYEKFLQHILEKHPELADTFEKFTLEVTDDDLPLQPREPPYLED